MASSRGLRSVCVALVLTILGACGGGGGSDNSTGGGGTGENGLTGTPPSNNPNAPVAVGAFAYVLNALSANISAYSINETTGALSEIPGSPFSAGQNPEAIAITPSGKFAYVANVIGNVMAYSIDAMTGAITRVGDPVDQSGSPGFIAMHPSGRAVYVASAAMGGARHHISAFAIDAATGLLSSIATTDLADFPTGISIDPAGRFAYVTRVEQSNHTNFLHVYAIDQTHGTLSEISGSPFRARSGDPNIITFEPSGRFAYSGTNNDGLIGYTVDPTTGTLSEIAGSPFSRSTIWVSVHPLGKFAYAHAGAVIGVPDQIATYAINDSTGTLTSVSSTEWSGQTHLAFSPSGRFVYAPIRNRDDRVYMGRVDPSTGTLTHIGSVGAGSLPQAIGITATYR